MPFSKRFVNITIFTLLICQTIRQKSKTVSSVNGPANGWCYGRIWEMEFTNKCSELKKYSTHMYNVLMKIYLFCTNCSGQIRIFMYVIIRESYFFHSYLSRLFVNLWSLKLNRKMVLVSIYIFLQMLNYENLILIIKVKLIRTSYSFVRLSVMADCQLNCSWSLHLYGT